MAPSWRNRLPRLVRGKSYPPRQTRSRLFNWFLYNKHQKERREPNEDPIENWFDLNSVAFDGVDESAPIAQPSLNFSTGWSISIWVNTTNGGERYAVGSKGGGSVAFGLGVFQSKAIYLNQPGFMQGTTDIDDGNWHLLTATISASDAGKLYVDGALEDTKSDISNIGLSEWLIGSAKNDNNWSGFLDELSVWDIELSQADVTELYNGHATFDLRTHSQKDYLYYYNPQEQFFGDDLNSGGQIIDIVTGEEAVPINLSNVDNWGSGVS